MIGNIHLGRERGSTLVQAENGVGGGDLQRGEEESEEETHCDWRWRLWSVGVMRMYKRGEVVMNDCGGGNGDGSFQNRQKIRGNCDVFTSLPRRSIPLITIRISLV